MSQLCVIMHEQCMGLHTLRELGHLTAVKKISHSRVYPNRSYLEQALGFIPDYDWILSILEKRPLSSNKWYIQSQEVRKAWAPFNIHGDLLFVSTWADVRYPYYQHKMEKWGFSIQPPNRDLSKDLTKEKLQEFTQYPPMEPEQAFHDMLGVVALWRSVNPDIKVVFVNFPIQPPLNEKAESLFFGQSSEELDRKDKKILEMSLDLCPQFNIYPLHVPDEYVEYSSTSKQRFHYSSKTYKKAARMIFEEVLK